MAWLGKVSLGGFPDLAGAVTKLSESVKNIEKNFDSALGLEEKPDTGEASGIWPSAADRKALFNPVVAFMGSRAGEESRKRGDDSGSKADGGASEQSEKAEASENPAMEGKQAEIPTEVLHLSQAETIPLMNQETETLERTVVRDVDPFSSNSTLDMPLEPDKDKADSEYRIIKTEDDAPNLKILVSVKDEANRKLLGTSAESQLGESSYENASNVEQTDLIHLSTPDSSYDIIGSINKHEWQESEEKIPHTIPPIQPDVPGNDHIRIRSKNLGPTPPHTSMIDDSSEVPDGKYSNLSSSIQDQVEEPNIAHNIIALTEPIEVGSPAKSAEDAIEINSKSEMMGLSDSIIIMRELEKVKKEKEMMEAALHGAARQAQAKADEIAKLMNENEQLKSIVDDLKRKSSEAEIDALRDEYHQRVAALERKVYALTRERDTLRREQNKRSDATALLKEKDEIITQVMAEGEELSKKQAAQESTIRKLRAQIRELEEDKQRINSKLQVEETKVESIKKDKAATEKLLQETIEKYQAEVATQKDFYTNELKLAKEAEALAEARVDTEARKELENHLKEAGERESMLVQALEDLRQALTRTELQAAAKEEMLHRDNDEIQKHYQESELRYNELITQVPDSTRPLLRQIEAMQETSASREEAWHGVERALNSRFQEAEAKAAAAEERERAMREQLSQSLSRINVLETQITCLRTERTQLIRSLEKERQRASENRQEYLMVKEEAATHEGHASQLEDEIKKFKSRHKIDMEEEITHRQLVEKELERERTARIELEKVASRQSTMVVSSNSAPNLNNTYVENGNYPVKKLSSAKSLSTMEESNFLRSSLESGSLSFERASGEITMSPYYLKSMTPSAFEAALRQKDGELASYISRLASTESIRDSLAEELVNLTRECENFRAEAAFVPGIRAELDALRKRHNAALELMGERDEELEELRADIIDLKEMYREQVDLLVNRIQRLNPQSGAA
ncbi:Golgin candidate 5 [Apostasia shenzhenica]|uniref:Golgin candidate 5 n=1 Tax=Apostasia shenzhenica TaxID=1088818 RepID=A0A2I0B512_9ASPA|nr:Golgin candidate 5 [Apostasia shenzhenica]